MVRAFAGAGAVLRPTPPAERAAAAARAYGLPLAAAAAWVAVLYALGGRVGVLWVAATMLAFFYFFTTREKAPLSGYSVFNKNFAAGLGQLKSDDFDRMRGTAVEVHAEDSTAAAVRAAAEGAAAAVAGTPLGRAVVGEAGAPADGSPAALLGALNAERAERARARAHAPGQA
jgi:hypothetical protein